MEDVLRPLSDIPAINRFLSYCRVRTIPQKTVMIHAGDLPDVLYYIVDGSVEVMIEDEDGNEMVLAYLNKGQFFGEMGLFYEQPTRSAWVRTRTESEIAEMTYPRFRQIASESPGIVFELATQLASRLDRTNRKLGDLAFVDVTGRVAHAIMDLCKEPDAMTHPEGRSKSRDRNCPAWSVAPGKWQDAFSKCWKSKASSVPAARRSSY
jgi:CRP/FNR family cyclic AMP-dependent transcriptional regulator